MAVNKTSPRARNKSIGFTLIESIIAIVILGIALMMLSSFLFPQIAQSAKPFYEVRASALADSLMTEILARNFDENSDHDGGKYRCGEVEYKDSSGHPIACTEQSDFGPDSSEPPALFNDVDDYLGCWYTTTQSQQECIDTTHGGPLNDIFGSDISKDYLGFRAEVKVVYDHDARLGAASHKLFKQVTVTVTASQYGDFTFVAHKGNY
ncbi:prepilin-type N-terminal cleavage/methylation domain-containing protein [Vibrio rarus]|uniref:type IV pilus modification PilV family protein n=1 Tax=Vibrio rarus TaxID=413403 RepID=UPI0021C2640D|nr:prepilin-type N-terminal cleavage/methylation domain-containing protein [Vibrio rarus]